MYTSIRVQNFRGLRDLKIDDLGRVNLIVGANNVGKTSVLEAISFLNANGDPYHLVDLVIARGIAPIVNSPELLISSLIGNSEANRVASIGGESGAGENRLLVMSELSLDNPQEYSSSRQYPVRYLVPTLTGSKNQFGPGLHLYWYTDSPHFPRSQGDHRQSQSIDPSQHASRLPYQGQIIFESTVSMSASEHLSVTERATRFSDNEATVGTESLVKMLREFDPRVRDIHLGLERLTGEDRQLLIRVKLDGVSKPLALSMLGGGVNRLFDISVSLPLAAKGLFLIDEIENGIYYENLSRLWSHVNRISKQYETQVFATTHSWECVSAAVLAFAETPSDFRMYRLERREEGTKAIAYHHDVALAAITGPVEVR